jgi:hypothetical protein
MTMRLIALCLLLSFAICGAAQELYTGEAAVQGQGDAERRAALPEALRNVLQKLSGLRELPAGPELDAGLRRAGSMVVATSYRQSAVPGAGADLAPQTVLVANFLPAAVDQLVRELQLPRWRPARQTVLVWALLDEGGGPRMMPLEYSYAWEYFAQILRNRGLPMAWVQPGEELLQTLDMKSVWSGDSDEKLLQTVGEQALGMLRARRVLSEWRVEFEYHEPARPDTEAPQAKTGQQRPGLVFAGQLQGGDPAQALAAPMAWQSSSVDLLQALAAVANQAVDQVARRNSLGAAGLGQWQAELLVTSLDDARAYARLLNYLGGLALVDDVQLLSVGPAGLRLRLTLNTDPQFLQASLRSDGVLSSTGQQGVYRMTRVESP